MRLLVARRRLSRGTMDGVITVMTVPEDPPYCSWHTDEPYHHLAGTCYCGWDHVLACKSYN